MSIKTDVCKQSNIGKLNLAEYEIESRRQPLEVKFGRFVPIAISALNKAEDVISGNLFNAERFSSGVPTDFRTIMVKGIEALQIINDNTPKLWRPTAWQRAINIMQDLLEVSLKYEKTPNQKEYPGK